MKDDYIDIADRLDATASANGDPVQSLLVDAAAMLRRRGEEAKHNRRVAERIVQLLNDLENTLVEEGLL